MKFKLKSLSIILALTASLSIVCPKVTYANEGTVVESVKPDSGFVYVHDPRLDEKAMADVEYNPKAVYGFSPKVDGSLSAYAEADFTDPVSVEKWRQERIQYHAELNQMFSLWDEMSAQGKSIEEIARAISAKRNQIKLDSYKDNPEGLVAVKKRNLEKYGNEEGPTADSLFAKYGSWETVLIKAFSTNSGMDACLGLYDVEYEHNLKTGASVIVDIITYSVQKGDNLCVIAMKYYGTQRAWINIYNANAGSIKDNYVILAGQKLIIPLY